MCNCNNTTNCGGGCLPCNECQETTSCICAVNISSDCVNNVTAEMLCSGIGQGQTLTAVLEQLDAFICTKFDQTVAFFTLINVGTGSQIYKGINGVGQKEIRSVITTGTLLTNVQNTNDITLSIDEDELLTFVLTNQLTYSALSIGTGVDVYKDTTVVGNNNQFNFRSILTENLGTGTSFLRDIQQNTNELNVRVKTLVSDNLTITSTDDEVRIETPMTASIPALYVNNLYTPTYNEWLTENKAQNGGVAIIGFSFTGKGSLAQPFCDSIVYPLLGGSPTVTANTSIQNSLDGDLIYSYVGAGTRLAPDKSGQQIIVQNNNSIYTFAGNLGYSNLNLKLEGIVVSTTTGYILDADNVLHFNNLDLATITLESNAILQVQGLGFNNSGSNIATTNFTDVKTVSLLGEGRIESLLNVDPLTRYVINSDITETGNNNDGGLTFDIRCFVRVDYQGIYNIKGNSRIFFREALLQSGNTGNTVDLNLKAFNQEGGTISLTNNTNVIISGGTRTNGITFTPNPIYITSYSNNGGVYQGACVNLFNKLNSEDVSFTVVDSNSGTNLSITNVFESPNLWEVLFKNNNLATGNIDITKADLTFGNSISAINTIGSNVIEILRQFDDRADALANSVPLYSAYIKTNGVAYPTTSTWVRDIVLPA